MSLLLRLCEKPLFVQIIAFTKERVFQPIYQDCDLIIIQLELWRFIQKARTRAKARMESETARI